jgi:hypothetical protein
LSREERDTGPLTPLVPRSSSGVHQLWRMVPPRGDESVRFQRIDGAWIAVSLDIAAGTAWVLDGAGRRVPAASYEDALQLALSWRE